MSEERHEHHWEEVTAEDDGHILCRCACGQQRLLAGTTMHGRVSDRHDWITPGLWNRVPEGAWTS